ncbi:transcription factor IIF subunit TFG1 [Sporobolomyces koalae]|uniref:transcription factor IIF subunit TFG1 n=1 Tax=Sporobolomyces koalae TaxID=500713 RepID=UPI003182AFF6
MFHKKKAPMPLRTVKREPSHPSNQPATLPSPSTDSSATTTPAGASPLPTSSNYTDFILRSCAPPTESGWKHNIMKFAALGEKVVDPGDESVFVRPVRLNRKDPRTVRRLTDQDRERFNQRAKERAAQAAGVPMQVDGADPDSKDGIKDEADDSGAAGAGDDDKKPKEQLDPSLVGKGTSGYTAGSRARGPGGMFKKKIRRVFVASEESRRLKREEWQPWVLEDDEGQERWIGRLEGGAGEVDVNGKPKPGSSNQSSATGTNNNASLKGWRPAANASEAGGGGSSYVAFVFGENGDEFQVVPINRWYKFNQGPKYLTLAEEEAEEEWNRQQKTKETERWVMHKRIAPAPSTAPTSGESTPQPSTSATSVAPARGKKAGKNAKSARSEGTLRDRMIARSAAGIKIDEDDDTKGRPRIKSVISTNDGGTRSGGRAKGRGGGDQDDDEFDYEEDFQDDEEGIAKIDDLADEDETKQLEERIRKEMRGAERPDEIPDDLEGEDDEELTGTGREIKKLVKKSDKSGAYESDDDDNPYASSDEEDDNASVASGDRGGMSSRQTSPQPSGRAQSPSSHSRQQSPSRAGTPMSGSALLAKRATSPSGRSTSRNSSPGPSKRKRIDGSPGVDSDGDGSKRRKNGKAKSPSPGADQVGLLSKEDLIGFLKTRPNQSSSTKEVLVHFRKALKQEPKNKAAISSLIKAVADLVNGNLVLKAGL